MGIFILLFFIILIVLLYQKRVLEHKSQVIQNEKTHQKKLLDASLEIAEQERVKIAANMHDDVGVLLSVLKLHLHRIKKNTHKPDVIDTLVHESSDIIDSSINTIRTISNDLMPPTLINLGFVKGVKELSRQINMARLVAVNFLSEDVIVRLDKKIELQLYRLMKEILNNTIKHAKPKIIEITIEAIEHKLIITIMHDGIGITTENIRSLAETSTGLGLKSILTRTELIDATIEFAILNQYQSSVILAIPLL
jgi:two-component system, NarL family, sensor kinase